MYIFVILKINKVKTIIYKFWGREERYKNIVRASFFKFFNITICSSAFLNEFF